MSRSIVRAYAEAITRGDWKTTHEGIAFDSNGTLVDGQHRLAAIIEADTPVELIVFTDVPADTFDVLNTGKKRNGADTLAIEGEKNSHLLAAMIRAVYLYDHRPEGAWSGTGARLTNHQILQTLEAHPRLREFVPIAERIASATSMIKSAAGAAAYLTERNNAHRDLSEWYDGITEGAGLARQDPRLTFRNHMLKLAKHEVGAGQKRRETREHVALYVTAFNSWIAGETLPRLRYDQRQPLPPVHKG
ncbi:MAG: hypothetical protein J2P17_01335 [Mycobacterium sp.]|nr:hypothetical protein [Mycobacterium sp.]